MQLLELYKNSKESFLATASATPTTNKVLFLQSVRMTDFDTYQDVIRFVEDLSSIEFFNGISQPEIFGFISQVTFTLHIAYKQDPEKYLSFLDQYEFCVLLPGLDKDYSWFVMHHFLPGFRHATDEMRANVTTSMFKEHGMWFYHSGGCAYANYIPELIKLNSAFAKALYKAWSKLKHRNDYEKVLKKVLKAILEAGVVQEDCTAAGLLVFGERKEGKYALPNGGELVISPKKIMFKRPDVRKHALVIYGRDYNKAFLVSTEFWLCEDGYNVLVIDSRQEPLSTHYITRQMGEFGFLDLDLIHVNMHGGDPQYVKDTYLTLNEGDTSCYPRGVTAYDLFTLIMRKVLHKNKPITVILDSCYSQLATHQIHRVLPPRSIFVTLGEDHTVDLVRYTIHSWTYGEFVYEEDVRKAITKGIYGYKPTSWKVSDVPSFTYGQIGVCNFRTPSAISQKDVKELLSHVPKDEVASSVAEYLGDGKAAPDVIKFFSMVESSTDEYPLLKYRANLSNKVRDSNTYLAVAAAIYGIYDQCGKRVISDSGFVPEATEEPKDDSILGDLYSAMSGLLSPITDEVLGRICDGW